MESQEEVSEPRLRGLVSLEGDTDAISVQLRLLPPSSNIMVLLPLASEVQRLDGTTDFNARSYTRFVHDILSQRIDKARSFLNSSTFNQPRLVFMNGGCLSARMICISTFCEKVTQGDIRAAEMLFEDIAKDGVAGLLNPPVTVVKKQRKSEKKHEGPVARVTDEKISLEEQQLKMSHHDLDPITAALKAAEALYRDTAALQPSMWDDLDTTRTKEFLPDTGDTCWDISQDLLDYRTAMQVDMRDAIKTRKPYYDYKRDALDSRPQPRSSSRSASVEVSVGASRIELAGRENRYRSEKRQSLPPGLPTLNVEAACVFDPQSAQKTIRRPHSVGNPSSRIPMIPTREASARSMKSTEPTKSSENASDGAKSSRSSQVYEILPRVSNDKPSETDGDGMTQMNTPTPTGGDRCSHIDQGADAENVDKLETTTTMESHVIDFNIPTEFQPLFSIVEELVVHVSTGDDSEVFESVIRSYKHEGDPNTTSNGARILRQPVSPTSYSSSHESNLSSDSLTSVDSDEDEKICTGQSIVLAKANCIGFDGRGQGRELEKAEGFVPSVASGTCPTQVGPTSHDLPEPPRTVRESLSAITNAVGVQNSIRALLNTHFPPKSTYYRQHIFPLENDRFWKPVFSNSDSTSGERKTVDLMLALGIEEGVDQNFCQEIAGRVEKLGLDETRGNKIRKLDIRYLVVQAMQTFTTQPLAFQAGENPFKQPSLLATLMVPHLESFLSCNEPTSIILLYYPPSHLATVLALRELVGSEMMKVAGIVNSLSQPPKPKRNSYASIRSRYSTSLQESSTASHGSQLGNKRSQKDTRDSPSFSEADFLLLTTASDSEISHFLTSVFLTLPGRGSFYLPSTTNPSPVYSEPHVQPLQAPKPLSPIKPFPLIQGMGIFPSPPRTLYSSTGQPLPPNQPAKTSTRFFKKSPSLKEIRTSQDYASRMLRKEMGDSPEEIARMIGRQIGKEMIETASERLRRGRKSEKEWRYCHMDPELEEEYDEWERIFIPQMAKRVTTPQKALRWLGLA